MLQVCKRVSFTLAVAMLGATLLIACGSSTSNVLSTKSANTSPQTASVTIPQGQDLFTPFILAVQPNTIVTWQNNDSVSHTIMTTWDQSTFLNPQAFSLSAAAGQKVSFTFTKPGLYYYYCSAHADVNLTWHRIQAHKDASEAPIPMEGFVLVVGS